MLRGSVPSTSSRALGHFSRSPQANIPRSKFNRSHGIKTTFDEGQLVPILVDEMLPGDTFHLNLHAFVRMSTPIFPIMDNLYLETFFFAVPNRLLWDNWEQFNGYNSSAGIQTTDYVLPTVTGPTTGGVATSDLSDYFGIPVGKTNLTWSALPSRAYTKIWNDWFRDQNMQDEIFFSTGDGPDAYAQNSEVVLIRNKRYDYFTSCLPWPQKSADQLVPLNSQYGDNAWIVTGTNPISGTQDEPNFFVAGSGSTTQYNLQSPATGSSPVGLSGAPGVLGNLAWSDVEPNSPGLYVDTTGIAGTINELREAFQMQKLYERDARGGTRYTEIIKAHFGVNSPDMRLQRSEYIGGGSSPIIVNPVAQTTQATTPTNKDGLGVLGAYGVCAVNRHGFTYSATEHMTIIGLVSVRADLNYQQGLERMWSRETRFDFYWPALSHLGEQAVLNQEIYAQGTDVDTEVFGYQERYAEYRYKPSQITGLFRSTATTGTPLDAWHLAQNFGSLPLLNGVFIQENAPMSRIEAVTTEPDFILDGFFSYMCARPMPVYAVPGLVDHF